MSVIVVFVYCPVCPLIVHRSLLAFLSCLLFCLQFPGDISGATIVVDYSLSKVRKLCETLSSLQKYKNVYKNVKRLHTWLNKYKKQKNTNNITTIKSTKNKATAKNYKSNESMQNIVCPDLENIVVISQPCDLRNCYNGLIHMQNRDLRSELSVLRSLFVFAICSFQKAPQNFPKTCQPNHSHSCKQ